VAIALGIVLGLVGLLLLGLLGLFAGIVVAVVLALVVGARATSVAVNRSLGQPAPTEAYPRYHNLVEGLCIAAGVPKPRLLVAPDDAPNAMSCGRNPREATMVVTEGLLAKLSRIELEGVLAHEISHIRHLDVLPATLAVTLAAPVGSWAVRRVVGAGREAEADANAVSLTRDPPGLLAALEKISQDPAVLAPRSRTIAHLWLVPTETVGARRVGPTISPIDERIEALREL
jgi:heat shock protein HtpX